LELPAHPEPPAAWNTIRAELRRTVGESTYDIWLAPIEASAWDGAVLLLSAPPATQAWVADRFGRVLERCAQSVLGPRAQVAFAGESAHLAHQALNAGHSHPESFIPRYTFEQFIIGDANHMAHAAALAVAESPGQTYNPLFLHAPPGLGKTHLLHAIGNYITMFDPASTVRYTTAEAFTNGFIAALKGRDLDRFKRLYRDVDVLLIDDVQFLASKSRTEEEFFHTFNAVHDRGRQLVLTCDRIPRQLVGIEQRLRERFEAGLVARISAPDRATRITILRKRAALDRLSIPEPAVFEMIADRVLDNIRSLEGALIRVVAAASLLGRPIDAELAARVLDDIHPQPSPGSQITVAQIQSLVAEHFGISIAELISSSRLARIAWPRQLAIALCREHTAESLQSIGEAFGHRNHATVLHACKRVSDRISTNGEQAVEYTALTARIRDHHGDDPADRPDLLTD
jgi:chromosomal replication initiator protein